MSLQMGIPICPITYEVMREPVIDREGNTYEKSAILEWLKNSRTSPVTRSYLCEEHLVPNRALLNISTITSTTIPEDCSDCSNCSKCNKIMKVSNYKGTKQPLCFNCRDWDCHLCTFTNKCTSKGCEICRCIRAIQR